MTALTLDRQPGGIARLTLNRPEVHNAFDDALIAELSETLDGLAADEGLRALVLAAAGKSFSAGADLGWMQRMAGYGMAENLADATALAELMHRLDRFPRPTVALVQGAAYGGGVGLTACCDIVLATERARFCLSEVKLGLIPAVIAPYVVAAIGARAARRYFLTAEVFDAATAAGLGLVHEVVAPEDLETRGAAILAALAEGGPQAQRAAKRLIAYVSVEDEREMLKAETARRIAALRASPEGMEGLAAFLEKRRPGWVPEEGA